MDFSICEDDDITLKTKAKLPVNLLLSEANAYSRQLQFGKAISTYQKILDQDSSNFKALLGRAKVYLRLGKYSEAEEGFSRAVNVNPKSTEAMYLKGVAEFFRGDFEKSFDTHLEGSKKRPISIELRENLQLCEHVIRNTLEADADTRLQKEDIKNVYEINEKTDESRYDPKSFYSKDLIILDSMLKNKDLSSTVHEYSQDAFEFLQSRQRFAKALTAGWGNKRKTQQLKYRNRQSTVKSRLRLRIEEIRSYLEKGKTDTCVTKVKDFLNSLKKLPVEKVPEKAEIEALAFHYLGLAYLLDEQTVSAVNCFEKQLSIGRKHRLTETKVRALRDLGELHMGNGQYDKALKRFRECAAAASSDEQAALLYKLSDCATHLNDFEFAQQAAEDCLKRVVKANDGRFQLDVLLLLAEIAVSCKKMDAAFEYYKEALQTASNNHDSREKQVEKLLDLFQNTYGEKLGSDERFKIVNITQKLKSSHAPD